MNLENSLFEYDSPLDYSALCAYVSEMERRYDVLSVASLTKSTEGREIPLIRLGSGQRELVYVGAHHGMEWITSVILLRFINDFCEVLKTGKTTYGVSLDYLLLTRTFWIVPMLNVDGVELAINGPDTSRGQYELLLRMNGSEDFSHWQANGRGVDLNHNYNYRFDEYKVLEKEAGIGDGAPTRYSGHCPESEPESAALAELIRTHDIGLILTLHSQGEEIFTLAKGPAAERCAATGAAIARMSGYRLSCADGMAAYGGLTDWACGEMGIPSFTIECGKGQNPLPLADYLPIYTKLRRTLFTCAVLQ